MPAKINFPEKLLEALKDARVVTAFKGIFKDVIEEIVDKKVKIIQDEVTALKLTVSELQKEHLSPNVGKNEDQSITHIVSSTLVEIEKQKDELREKSVNVVVVGLKLLADVPDNNVFANFCEDNLTIKPRVVRSRRIGKNLQEPKLCVTLDSAECVNNLLESARILRHSTDLYAKEVYINRDLTRTQAEAAYKARCLRRTKKTANNQLNSTEHASGSSASQPFSL